MGRRAAVRWATRWLAPLVALAATAAPARPQITLLEGDRTDLLLSGYVRSLTAGHDRGYEIAGAARRAGLHSEVLRIQWQLRGPTWSVDAHNRIQVRITDEDTPGPGVGLGVSAIPGRSLDLSTTFVDRPGFRAWHDVDRLSVTARIGPVDVTAGRQPITWGVSTLFPVADLWTSFSPFELDATEKPGVDAVRVFAYPTDRLELDIVIADRGTIEDLSVGARGTLGLPAADLWLGAGKLWRQAMIMGGATLLRDETRLRAEAVLPHDLDGDGMMDPRLTLGLDWIRSRLSLTGEYHFNGIGAAGPDGYLAVLAGPRLARGETYYLGRHYLGAAASWTRGEEARLNLGISALLGLSDASAALTPVLSYDIGQAATLSAGALASFGDVPLPGPPPTIRSEFGLYGNLVFTRISLYF